MTAAGGSEDELRPWRVDLHAHTDASPDCLLTPRKVVGRAREAGLDRIAITDHDRIEGAFAARDLDPELVIVAEEVRSAEGPELIGLFLTEHIPGGLPFREIAAEIRDQGGVTYLPHPFDRRRGGSAPFLDHHADCVDVVEVLNARTHAAAANHRALAWALEHGKAMGGGSDAHLRGEIGRVRTRLRPFRDAASFLEVARDARVEGRTSGRWVHLGSTWAKVRKRLPF